MSEKAGGEGRYGADGRRGGRELEIGAWMTTNYVAVREDASVRAAMKELISQAGDNDNISTIYATDEHGVFVGAIDLKTLIVAREGALLSALIQRSYPCFYVHERIEECIERIKEHSEYSYPVLDGDGRLCGALLAQDITELVEETLGEDYAMLAGLPSEDDPGESVKKGVAKRLPWLVSLLLLGLVVSGVAGIFEGVVSHIAVLVSFQPLILGMSGNVGTQSLAVTIRALTDGGESAGRGLRLAVREVRIGLINGVLLGVVSFFIIGGYLMLVKGHGAVFAFSVSACTALAMAVSILLSSVSGTLIPMLFQKMNIDPAVASGPLITTVNDLVAVVSYYGLAWVLLIGVLGL